MARQALSGARTIEVLDFMVAHPTESFTLSEIAQRLGINLSSAHAVLGVMTEAGYLVRHPTQRTYSLGPLLVAVGQAAAERHPVLELATSHLRPLADELGVECLVLAPAGSEMVIVGRVGSPRPHRMKARVGQRIPLVPPFGAVFAAWAPDDQVESWLERAPGAPARERRRYRDILAAVRERGFSVGLADPARTGMKRALDALDETPRSTSARSALASSLDQLARPETVLVSLDARARYRVAHVAAPMFDAWRQAQLGAYLIGFRDPVAGRDLQEVGDRLVDATLLVTRLAAGRVPVPTGGDPSPG